MRSRPFAANTQHGTSNGYTNYGCRCEDCKTAHATTTRERKAARPPLAPDDPRHGLRSSYGNHKCRCDLCRAANTASAREYRERTERTEGGRRKA